MSSVITYNIAGDSHEFRFVTTAFLPEIIVKDVSPLKQGYDNLATDDVSVYPSNLELIINDDAKEHFHNLKNQYNNAYPFNYEDVFYLEWYKNGTKIFKGYLESISASYVPHEAKLRFTDGINKLKNAVMGNPYILEKLYNRGFIKRNYYHSSLDVYQYGFGAGVTVQASADLSLWEVTPGFIHKGEGAANWYDSDCNLKNLITELFKILDNNITVVFDTSLVFTSRNGRYSAPFSELIVKNVLMNLLGRYVVIKKETTGFSRKYVMKNNGDSEFNTWSVAFEDEQYISYWHNWRGANTYINPSPPNVQTVKYFNQGLGPLRINELLKTLAKNFFAKFCIETPGVVKWQDKVKDSPSFTQVNYLTAQDDESSEITVTSVKVKDVYNGLEQSSAAAGVNAELEDTQKIEHEIPFTCQKTVYDEGERLVFYVDELDDFTAAAKVQDVFFNKWVQEYVAYHEYWKQFKSYGTTRKKKYSVLASGTDYLLTEHYQHNEVKLRPITTEKYEITQDDTMRGLTKITGVEA